MNTTELLKLVIAANVREGVYESAPNEDSLMRLQQFNSALYLIPLPDLVAALERLMDLEKLIETRFTMNPERDMAAAVTAKDGWRDDHQGVACVYCGHKSNVELRRCCEKGYSADLPRHLVVTRENYADELEKAKAKLAEFEDKRERCPVCEGTGCEPPQDGLLGGEYQICCQCDGTGRRDDQ